MFERMEKAAIDTWELSDGIDPTVLAFLILAVGTIGMIVSFMPRGKKVPSLLLMLLNCAIARVLHGKDSEVYKNLVDQISKR